MNQWEQEIWQRLDSWRLTCPMDASQWRSVELPRLSQRHISALKGLEVNGHSEFFLAICINVHLDSFWEVAICCRVGASWLPLPHTTNSSGEVKLWKRPTKCNRKNNLWSSTGWKLTFVPWRDLLFQSSELVSPHPWAGKPHCSTKTPS